LESQLSQSSATPQIAPPRLHFRVPPEPSHLLRARERLRDYLRQYCTERQVSDDVVLCVEEACTNAIRHGDSPEDIEIALHFTHTKLVATVKDHGRGFDVARFDPKGGPDPLLDHGRGLYIIAKLMDSLELRIDGGLEVHMTRRAEPRCESAPLESGLGEPPGDSSHHDVRVRAMLEEIDEAFLALDWEYRYVHVNEAMLRFTQTSRDELLGHVIWDLFPALKGSPVQERYREAMELGRPSVFEHRAVVTGDWLEIRIYPTSVGISAYYREINERKRAETRLRESQALLQAVLDGSPDPIFVKDQESRILLGNAALLEVWGKPAEEVIGKNDRELYDDPVIGEAMMENDRAVMDSGRSQVIEEVVQTQDGLRTYLSTKSPYRNGEGEIVGILGIARDISERKRLEEALRDAEARSSYLVRNAPIAIYEIDFRGPRFKAVNDAVCELSGYERDELFAIDPIRVLDPESQVLFAERIKRGLAGEPLSDSVEYRFKTKDGRLRDVVLNTSFTYTDGAIDGALVVAYDITERKRAEEALRHSEEAARRAEARYRTLFNTLIEGFCIIEMVFDADGKPVDYRFLEINEVFEEQTGLHDAQGKLMRDLAPDHEQHWFDIYGKVATIGEPTRFMAPAAALGRYYDVSAFRVGGPESRQVGILFNDISERHRAEEERQRLLEESQAQAEELQTQSEELRVQGEELQVRYDEELAGRAALLRENELRAGLSAIGELLHSTLEPDEVMRRALGEATRALAIDAAAIELSEGGAWPVRYAEGLPTEALGSPLAGEPAIARLVAFSGEALVLDDAAGHEMVGPFAIRCGIRSLMAVPLLARDEILGVLLLVERRAAHHFERAEVDFALRLSTSIGLALENARLFERERQAAKLNAALSAVDRAIHSSLDFAEIVQTALREGASILGTETASLCLHDDEAKRFRVAYGHNYPADKLGILVSDADDTHGVEAMRTGDTLAINDTHDDPRVVREFADAWNIKSVICAPLVVRGRPIAVAYFNYHTATHRFSDQEIEFVTKLASSLSTALENAQLHEHEAEVASLAQVLNEMNGLINSTLDAQEIMQTVVEQAVAAVGADSAMVALRHGDDWVAEYGYPEVPGVIHESIRTDEAPFMVAAVEQRRPIAIDDCENDSRCIPEVQHRFGVRSVLCMPLIARDEVIGVIFFNHHKAAVAFPPAIVDFAAKLSVAISTALANAHLYETQRTIATTLQQHFIHPLPVVEGLDVGLVSHAATEPELVGGDFSDVFIADEGHVMVLIGDVAGKGVRAAGMTETVRSTVRALAAIDPSPAFILGKTNELLLRYDPDEPHVTAFLAALDPRTGHLSYASAGHPAPVHLGAFTCRPLDVRFGPPLGSFERPHTDSHAMLTLEDYLVLYTDGVTEARRSDELLGEQRLLEIVSGLRGCSAQEVADGVRDAALAFASRLHDDLQVVVIRLD
jgi:PAS domain S-box-containing protein